jgi:osmotically-inducible protein OsmY
MSTTSFYRPCAVVVKAALLADSQRRFGDIVVENDHGAVILRGALSEEQHARDAGDLATDAGGGLVVNYIVVSAAEH